MEVSPRPSPSSGFRAQNAYAPPPPQPSSASATPVVQYGPVQSQTSPPHDAPTSSPSATPTSTTAPPATTAAAAAAAAATATRTRHSSACFPCAKRKVKCDRDVKNPCSNCQRRSQPEQCQVKSQKDKLSHQRSDPALRDAAADAHRDKRPRYEAFQTSFHAAPNSGADPGLHPGAHAYAPHDDRGALANNNHHHHHHGHHGSREASLWDAIEALLPPRKDLLKYLGTYRIGPHVVNPVIANLDAFESHVCTFLEEIGTPRLKMRLAGDDRRASEVELGRLARLLAVLAAGSRYEDSDYATQAAISRDYVRKAFKCLRLANFMIRPTVECVQTLILLSSELQNDQQPGAAWAMLGTTARLAHSIGINCADGPSEHDFGVARSSIAWQDMMLSVWHKDPNASLALRRAPPSGPADDKAPAYLASIADVYRSAIVCLGMDVSAKSLTSSANSELLDHVDLIRGACRAFSHRECKSMRDRYEVAGFKMHCVFLLSSVLLRIGDLKADQSPSEAHESDEAARAALLDLVQTFVDFSTISSLPVRSFITIHYAVTAALELCRWPHAPDGAFLGSLLPRLLSTLDGMAGHVTNGASAAPISDMMMSGLQLDAIDLLDRIWSDSRQVYSDRIQTREIPESLRAEAAGLLMDMAKPRDVADDAHGPDMPLQAIWGL